MYASGKYSYAVCDRCGFRYPMRDIVTEPKTHFRVCSFCNDGEFNLISHPQNGPFPVTPDPQSLRFPRPEVVLASAVEVSSWLTLTPGGS